MKNVILICICFSTLMATAQNADITTQLYDSYEQYKEPSLGKRRIKHKDLQPLISKYAKNSKFTVKKVGESIEGRDLSLISIGKGKTNVFLWSQMHGNEPTATQAIFDIFNFLDSNSFTQEKEAILSELTLHFLPMLNPDGAEVFQRRNTLGIDINRDAQRLQSPEGQTLKRVRDSLDADFGFNLHDQSTYYNAELTDKPATISYLAPAYNYEKDINEVRGNAMKVIVFMNSIIQKYAPGQVAKYNDDFEPRAFGDNIQKWGTSTILIESGGYPNDVEKQEIRKLNYVSILSAIYTIANGNYKNIPLEDYKKIPENNRMLFDLKIEAATYNLLGKPYILDIGIQRPEVDNADFSDFNYSSRVIDQGDLSTYYGYSTFNAEGYTIIPAKIYPEVKNYEDVKSLNFNDILKKGYAYVKVNNLPKKDLFTSYPVHLVSTTYKTPEFRIKEGINPTFFLAKNGTITHAVINGFLVDVNAKDITFKNSMIYR